MTAPYLSPEAEKPVYRGKLRWVTRWEHPLELAGLRGMPGKVRVLQQAIEDGWGNLYWEDVPEVDES